MRILLDECVAARLARDLNEHDVSTVRHMAWSGLKDGILLRRAALEFDVFLTVDKSLEHQQVIPPNLIFLTILSSSIEYKALRNFVPEINAVLRQARPGDILRIPDSRR